MSTLSLTGPQRRAQLAVNGAKAHGLALAIVGEQEDVDPVPANDLRTLDGQLAILAGLLRERLRDVDRRPLAAAEVAATSKVLHEIHTVRFSIHDYLGYERVRRLDDLDRGLAKLRTITDQNQLLAIACEVVAEHCGFDRVMLSRVEQDVWRPWRSYARHVGTAERSFRTWIEGDVQIRLDEMLLESDMVRRRQPVMVTDASTDRRVYRPMAVAACLSSYVAAPIIVDDRVIGLLHADHCNHDVDELDRDILWFFALGFAQVFERAVLLGRLRRLRSEVIHTTQVLQTVLEQLASAEVELATREHTTALAVSREVRPVVTERPEVLRQLLTDRELEVLALMATGATNDRIAQSLMIATETVKSHVKRILRKLEVNNRAEAISQYLRLTVGAREV